MSYPYLIRILSIHNLTPVQCGQCDQVGPCPQSVCVSNIDSKFADVFVASFCHFTRGGRAQNITYYC